PVPAAAPKAKAGGAEERNARKAVARIEKQLARIAQEQAQLEKEMADAAQDHGRLSDLATRLGALSEQKDELELEWLEAAAVLE
ncbi:MAG TPA: ABC transporter ATP-binding protein, partial [Nocardioides sp.]|nr:ABC transporter ATP-binding protein [Nocardioides sp.]